MLSLCECIGVYKQRKKEKYLFLQFGNWFFWKSKQYVGALITRQIIEELSKIPSINQTKIYRMLESKCFSDNTVLELFIQDKLPNQQDIADWYNKDKTDASRKIGKFSQKLQKNVNRKNY